MGTEASTACTDNDIAVLKETTKSWAQSVTDQDWAKFVGYWDENAVLMPPGHQSIEGRDNIQAFVQGEVGPVSAFTFTDWQFECSGALAVVSTGFDAGTVAGKHVIVLRRRPDDSWAIIRVIYNANG